MSSQRLPVPQGDDGGFAPLRAAACGAVKVAAAHAEIQGVTPPSILVVDDGELARVDTLLSEMEVDFERLTHPPRDQPLERPRDLLLTSGPRAMKMPPLVGDNAPVWACIYDQDFPPLRQRLRELGVNYLVSGELASRTFTLFLQQILHRGAERRGTRRIPVHWELELDVGRERRRARLLELSRESCVFLTEKPLPADEPLVVRLPAEQAGEPRLDLPARLVRASRPSPGEEAPVTAVVAFRDLDPDAEALIQGIVTGRARGTQVTPLAPEAPRPPEPEPEPEPEPALEPKPEPAGAERRSSPRKAYGQRVEAIRWHGEDGPRIALGRDLSLSGLRAEASPAPKEGAAVSLALYGGAREEPVLVEARVVRVCDEEVALRFEGLSEEQRRGVERLLQTPSRLESLGASDDRVHVIEIL